MEKDFIEIVTKRCEKEMLANEEYQKMQKQLIEAEKNNDIVKYENITADQNLLLMIICYMAGAKDFK